MPSGPDGIAQPEAEGIVPSGPDGIAQPEAEEGIVPSGPDGIAQPEAEGIVPGCTRWRRRITPRRRDPIRLKTVKSMVRYRGYASRFLQDARDVVRLH